MCLSPNQLLFLLSAGVVVIKFQTNYSLSLEIPRYILINLNTQEGVILTASDIVAIIRIS